MTTTIEAAAEERQGAEEQQPRRARLVEWRCDGRTPRGVCGKFIVELDPGRPSLLKRTCERCGHVNVWGEAYSSSAP